MQSQLLQALLELGQKAKLGLTLPGLAEKVHAVVHSSLQLSSPSVLLTRRTLQVFELLYRLIADDRTAKPFLSYVMHSETLFFQVPVP